MSSFNQYIAGTKKLSDGLLFFSIFFISYLIWEFILNIPVTTLYGTGDTLGLVAHYADMLKLGPTASQFLYSSSRHGGTVVGPTDMGIYFQFLSWLKLHPMLAVNLSFILTQVFISFFSVRIIQLSVTKMMDLVTTFFLIIVFSFNPALSWRLFYGHLNLAWGLIWGLAFVYLFLAAKNRRLTFTGSLLIAASFANALQCISLAQIILYIIIIASFMILIFWNELKNLWPGIKISLLPATILILIAILFSLVNVANLRLYLPSLSRLSDENMIYTYNVQNLADFISSLFYSYKTMKVDRDLFILHETNLGYGFLPLIFLALLPRFWKVKLISSVILLTLFAGILSSNIPFVSELIITVIPVLKKFRCPSRFFLIITYLQMLLLAWMMIRNTLTPTTRDIKCGLLIFIIFCSLFTLFPLNIDFLGVPLGITTIAVILFFQNLGKKYSTHFLALFVVVNVFSFKDKQPNNALTFDTYQNLSTSFDSVKGLESNLLEHTSTLIYTPFSTNQSAVFDYSSADGYIYPTKKLREIMVALNPLFPPLSYSFEINSSTPGFHVFSKLFNIHQEIRLNNDSLILTSLQKTQPYFIPSTVLRSNDLTSTLEKISNIDFNDSVLVEDEYAKYLETIQKCGEIKILNQSHNSATFNVDTSIKCLLVLPTQYSIFLKANKFEVIPVNWLMTGVVIPPFQGEFTIEANPAMKGEIYLKALAALLFLVFIFVYCRLISSFGRGNTKEPPA